MQVEALVPVPQLGPLQPFRAEPDGARHGAGRGVVQAVPQLQPEDPEVLVGPAGHAGQAPGE